MARMSSSFRTRTLHPSWARTWTVAPIRVLLEHDVTLDGRRRLVLAGLDDAVLGGGAGAQHLEDDHGVRNRGGVRRDGGTNDHSVRIAGAILSDQNFEVASMKFARLAAQAASDRDREVALDIGVGRRSSGHGGGFDAIEFVAQFLPLLPFEEFGERHGLAHGEVHGGHCSTVPHGRSLLLEPGDAEGRVAQAGARASGRPKPPRSEPL